LNIDAGRGRKPKTIADAKANGRRISFAFKVDLDISLLIKQCSKDQNMLSLKIPSLYKKLKKSRERAARKEPILLACNEE